MALAAFAADPNGTWKWSVEGRDGETFESSLKLEVKDDKVTGSISGRGGETPISDATFKDDVISFTVVREFNGNKWTSKFTGKIEGDSISGSSEFTRRDGETRKRDWNAKRVK